LLRIRSGARRSARPPGFRAVSGGRKRNRTRSQGRFWAVAGRSRLVETAALDRVRSARHHATRFPQAAHFVPSLRRLTVGRKSSRPHVEHNLPITLGTPLDPPRRLDAHRCRSPAPRATPGGHLVIFTSLMAGLRRSNVRQVYPHPLEQTCLRACGGSPDGDALASTAVTGSVGLHRLTSRPSMSVTRSGTPSAPLAVACPVFQFGTAKRKKAQFSPHANVIGPSQIAG
jgi:hypothetical protein